MRSGHHAYLDGWRGVCILLVLIGHFVPGLERVAVAGVEFFFALSGWLMAELLIFKRQPIPTFIRRRIARVGPTVAVYVLFVGAASNLLLLLHGGPVRVASPLGALFFFHNYIRHDAVVPMFEHTWSLAVEEHSYLVLIATVFLAGRRPLPGAAIALAVSGLALLNAYRVLDLPYSGGQSIYWRSDLRIGSVMIPFALCILMRQRQWKVPGWVAPVAILAALILILNADRGGPLLQFACSLLAAVGVNSLPQADGAVRRHLESKWLVGLGTLSFSIYVWQQLFYVAYRSGAPVALCIPALLACAVASFRMIEDPVRDHLNRRWRPAATGLDGPAVAVHA